MSKSPAHLHPDVVLAVELYQLGFANARPKTVLSLLSQYAKCVEQQFQNRHPSIVALSRNWNPNHPSDGDEEFYRGPFDLALAQLLAAREHGFATWNAVLEVGEQEIDARFEKAADAVVNGKLSELRSILEKHPELVKDRSAFGHRASLLHYISANGVETRRQISPPNAVEIADLLLSSGAEPDALAETYGGGSAQTTLCLLATSAHPLQQGVTPGLIKTLLKHGSNPEGIDGDGLPLRISMLHGHSETIDALVTAGVDVGDIFAAAASGNIERIQELANDNDWVALRNVARTYSFSRDIEDQANGDIYSILQRAIELARLHERSATVDYLVKLRIAYTESLDQFDESWNQGDSPELREFVPAEIQGAFAQRLLCDLVNIDLEYRWRELTNRSTSSHTTGDTHEVDDKDKGKRREGGEIGSRPCLEDYSQSLAELRAFHPLPLFLIKEEFRIRFETGDNPDTVSYIQRFPDFAAILPEQLENVLKEEADLFPTLGLDVYHKQSKVFSIPFTSRLEIGRRRPQEPDPYVLVETDEGSRLIIADLRERFMSRVHLELSPTPTGRVNAVNRSAKNAISMPLHLETLAPGESREFIPPVAFVVQTKTIRITISD